MLFLDLGRARGRRTSGSARSQAAAAVQDVIDRVLGPVAAGNVIVDGSGLSLHNRLTCPAVSALLALAGPGSPLVEGLSVAGESGSLSACPAVAAQSGEGGLNEVRAKTGVTVTFAMIANGPDIIRLGYCNRLWSTLLDAAAGYTYGPAAAGASRFVDVGPGVHAGAIEALAEAGITHGCDAVGPRFCPDQPASRAQMATLLARALGLRAELAVRGSQRQRMGLLADGRWRPHRCLSDAPDASSCWRDPALSPRRWCRWRPRRGLAAASSASRRARSPAGPLLAGR